MNRKYPITEELLKTKGGSTFLTQYDLEKIYKEFILKPNPHIGSSFDEFLEEEGILEEVRTTALNRVLITKL